MKVRPNKLHNAQIWDKKKMGFMGGANFSF